MDTSAHPIREQYVYRTSPSVKSLGCFKMAPPSAGQETFRLSCGSCGSYGSYGSYWERWLSYGSHWEKLLSYGSYWERWLSYWEKWLSYGSHWEKWLSYESRGVGSPNPSFSRWIFSIAESLLRGRLCPVPPPLHLTQEGHQISQI